LTLLATPVHGSDQQPHQHEQQEWWLQPEHAEQSAREQWVVASRRAQRSQPGEQQQERPLPLYQRLKRGKAGQQRGSGQQTDANVPT
jgi:hypothetical protein